MFKNPLKYENRDITEERPIVSQKIDKGEERA